MFKNKVLTTATLVVTMCLCQAALAVVLEPSAPLDSAADPASETPSAQSAGPRRSRPLGAAADPARGTLAVLLGVRFPLGLQAEVGRVRWRYFQLSFLQAYYGASWGFPAPFQSAPGASVYYRESNAKVRTFGLGLAVPGAHFRLDDSGAWELGVMVAPLSYDVANQWVDVAADSGSGLQKYQSKSERVGLGLTSLFVARNGRRWHLEAGATCPLYWKNGSSSGKAYDYGIPLAFYVAVGI